MCFRWVERTPGLIEYLEGIMPWAVKDDSIKRHSQKDALPIYGMMKRVSSVVCFYSFHRKDLFEVFPANIE